MSVLPYTAELDQKWLYVWPEQRVLKTFIAKPIHAVMQAWSALLFELYECAFALEHDSVREQKALWWAQELRTIGTSKAQHPISCALQKYATDFARLVEPFMQLAQQTPLRAANTNALFQALHAFSEELACVEQQLFGGIERAPSEAITLQLLLMRLPHGLQAFDRALVPMHLLARHQSLEHLSDSKSVLRDWLQELLNVSIPSARTCAFRAAHTAFCQRRLIQLQKNGQSKLVLGHTVDAWRAVRSV